MGVQAVCPGVIVLTGCEGVGKSELLLAFAHKHRHDFAGGVHWVRGPEVRVMRADLLY